MFRTDNRSGLLPLPTEKRPRPEIRPGKGVSGNESPRKLEGLGPRGPKLLEELRGDPTVRSSGDYDQILDSTSKPLSDRTVTQTHERDDPLVEKLVAAQDPDRDPDVELAVDLARDPTVLDLVVDEVSGGRIPTLSKQVSAETLAGVKDEVADAIRGEPHRSDPQGIGARREKRSPLDVVKAAVTRTIDTIRRAVAREPVNSVAKEVKAFSKARQEGKPEQQVMREMAAKVGRLDDTELLKLYRTTLSLDMVEYRLHLANRAEAGPEIDPEACSLLESLNSYEGMVHAEVIERQLGAPADAEKRAAHRELAAQSDSYLRGDPDAVRRDVELAVGLARDTAELDRVVNEASDGRIPKLSEQVSAETLARVKEHVAEAVLNGPHGVDTPVIGKSFRDDQEVVGRIRALALVREAVTTHIGAIRDAVARAPIHSVAEEVIAFSAERLKGTPEQQVTGEMAAKVGRLSNTDLLKLYRTTLSLDMVEYRLHLANLADPDGQDDPEARLLLESLESYQNMVHAEVVKRTEQPAGEVGVRTDDGDNFDFQVIDHGPKLGQLGALANTEKRAALREVQTEDPAATAKLANTGLTAEQVGDALRSADLTINVGLKLFAKGGGFRDPSGALVTSAPRMKNIYELPQAKGPIYLERRQMVEHALEPATEHADRSGIDPSNHPISAGVNVGRKIAGAASGYGDVVLVLKDSVKDRCTFTASDSFNVPFSGARATPEKIARFKAKVAEMREPGGGLSEPDREELLKQDEALIRIFERLDGMVDQGFPADRPMDHFLTYDLLRDIGPLQHKLANVAMDCFMERPAAGSDHVTTPERMSHIIADLNQNVVEAIATGVQDEQRINLPVNKYVEAQVYGGIDLANDVAEIRFVEKDVSKMKSQQEKEAYLDSVEGLRQMADELGVRVVRYKPEEAKLAHLDT